MGRDHFKNLFSSPEGATILKAIIRVASYFPCLEVEESQKLMEEFSEELKLFLKNEKLDTLTKHCEQLCVMLIDETSLMGATFLYQVDKWLWEINNSPLAYFGNFDIIFSDDLFQA